ncbi:band 3 anion transport protein-like isoform X2 [Dermacentor albipictus]|uniref:band 3 anion transport protein-like isoform X2 n=1 Tax=Dermacentor albipictus TaxID=60249 RepID=UPI0031FC2A71
MELQGEDQVGEPQHLSAVKMEGRRSSQLWKDEGSVLEAIDELMAPSSDFSLSDIQDKQEAKSTKEHQYDEEDYKMHRGAGFPHHHQPLKKHHYHRRRSSAASSSGNQDPADLPAVAEAKEPSQSSKDSEEDADDTIDVELDDDHEDSKVAKQPKDAAEDAAGPSGLKHGTSAKDKKTIGSREPPRIFVSSDTEPEVEFLPGPVKPRPSDVSLTEKPLKSSLKKSSISPDDQPLGSYGFFPNLDTRTADYGKQYADVPLSSTVRDSSQEQNESEGGQHKVAFILGSDSTEEASPPQVLVSDLQPPSTSKGLEPYRTKDRHHHHHHRHKRRRYVYDPSLMVLHDAEDKYRVITEPEEAMTLQSADLEEMASHRFEDQKGMRRHKILAKNTVLSFMQPASEDSSEKPPPSGSGKRYSVPFMKKLYDRKPHEVFVELDELVPETYEWKETARWIKYEENLKEDVERWGKPHLASLSFHSLLCLRKCIEQGTVLLDLEEKDLTGIANKVVDNMVLTEQIPPESHGAVLRVLLLRHRHAAEKGLNTFLRRNSSGTFTALKSLRSASLVSNFTSSSQDHVNGNAGNRSMPLLTADTRISIDKGTRDETEPFLPGCSTDDLRKPDANILRRIPEDAEAIAVLVGGLDFLEQPTIAFVRLAQGQVMPNLMEVPIPVRFFFILLGPSHTDDLDYHEVGRSISTLMSNTAFHTAAYKAEDRRDLLRAMNEFLDDSVVLPPGDWDRKSLLPVDDLKKKYEDIRKRKMQTKKPAPPVEDKAPQYEPLKRSGRLFGGLCSDIKNRYPWYLSDFKDALDGQCLATAIFIYFAALSGAVTFGGLLGDKTNNLIGVSETLVATCATGIIFALFSGQPLVIIGVTGPVLLFDELLYSFCQENDVEFLAIRVWIGMWIAILATLVVAFEGSALVRFFTRFTQEIFASLISLLYIYESFYKLYLIFVTHPLLKASDYCDSSPEAYLPNNISAGNWTDMSAANWTDVSAANWTDVFAANWSGKLYPEFEIIERTRQPNTALLSLILMFSTFFLADFLRKFRNSSFLGRNARRALGDFGIPIAIIAIVTLDFFVPNTYSQKLKVPNGLSTSIEGRGWFVSPISSTQPFIWWHIFVAALGAVLVFILMFLEIEICELILSKKERKLQKGSGFHLDLLLICYMELGCAIIGAPWMCAATVRSVSHLASLTVMSRTHAPGESPHIIGVKEQRVTNLIVALLVGLSVFMSPLLREVPVAVLFGVFLYMGITSMIGIQLFERIILFFKPTKHFPGVPYAQKVKATKMHLYTLLQVVCLIVLWAVKSSSLALAFPFVLLLMIPLRLQLKYIFTEKELQCLDGEDVNLQSDEEDDPDFYQQTLLPS